MKQKKDKFYMVLFSGHAHAKRAHAPERTRAAVAYLFVTNYNIL